MDQSASQAVSQPASQLRDKILVKGIQLISRIVEIIRHSKAILLGTNTCKNQNPNQPTEDYLLSFLNSKVESATKCIYVEFNPATMASRLLQF